VDFFQTAEKLKEFDNKVAHFEGNLESYVIVDKPFTQGFIVVVIIAIPLWSDK
jgi:hypothetical protein